MSVTESIVHLPSWGDGSYLYTFLMMIVIILAARFIVEALKRENKNQEEKEKRAKSFKD